jgi:hypothetical protein
MYFPRLSYLHHPTPDCSALTGGLTALPPRLQCLRSVIIHSIRPASAADISPTHARAGGQASRGTAPFVPGFDLLVRGGGEIPPAADPGAGKRLQCRARRGGADGGHEQALYSSQRG